jgi:hypothetical protein
MSEQCSGREDKFLTNRLDSFLPWNLLFLYLTNEVEFGQDILQGCVSSYYLYMWFFYELRGLFCRGLHGFSRMVWFLLIRCLTDDTPGMRRWANNVQEERKLKVEKAMTVHDSDRKGWPNGFLESGGAGAPKQTANTLKIKVAGSQAKKKIQKTKKEVERLTLADSDRKETRGRGPQCHRSSTPPPHCVPSIATALHHILQCRTAPLYVFKTDIPSTEKSSNFALNNLTFLAVLTNDVTEDKFYTACKNI